MFCYYSRWLVYVDCARCIMLNEWNPKRILTATEIVLAHDCLCNSTEDSVPLGDIILNYLWKNKLSQSVCVSVLAL